MIYIAEQLKTKGYNVSALFIHPSESLFRDHSYLAFRKNHSSIKTYDLNNLIIDYWSKYKNPNCI